ncbi:MAG TPA: glutathione S-transferase family protein [Burkholderiales bacterium]|jgi:glutathione S-transferase|nr:glutathione S-transferase family protein [Burkholderiales bacterium]
MASRYMLCSFKTCPWVQRAAIVLQAKQVPYDITYIDRDNRPAWFLAVSPHAKVPVVQIDGKEALFESNAIAEYLEETAEPRLHPQDPIARARNRAWTDYVPTFASAISNTMYSDSEEEFASRAAKLSDPFKKLEEALAKRGNDGPYFNGPKFSLVDAAYAPFLQRYTFMDRLRPLGVIEKFPKLAAWRNALVAAPAVKASTVSNIEDVWQENLILRKRWLSKFVSEKVLGAALVE